MSLATIRAQYKAILETVPDIGIVHDYERWSADWSKFLERCKNPSTQDIRFWTITRQSSAETFKGGSGSERRHVIVIRGYMGLKDDLGTEKTFQDLVETVCETFRGKTTLNNVVEQVAAPLQVNAVEARQLGMVLCHYCELSQTVEETLTFTMS